MFKKTNTVDAVLATFTKTIAALTNLQSAKIDESNLHHANAADAKNKAIEASDEAKRAGSIIDKLNKLVA